MLPCSFFLHAIVLHMPPSLLILWLEWHFENSTWLAYFVVCWAQIMGLLSYFICYFILQRRNHLLHLFMLASGDAVCANVVAYVAKIERKKNG